MNRRDCVLALLAMGTAGEPVPAFAQEQRPRAPLRIGLVPDFRGDWAVKLFNEAMGALGRVDGRDYVFIRSGVFYGPETRLALQRVLDSKPDLILTMNLGYAVDAYRASKTIPIVMWISGFPVEGGVAESLARPGKNVTGMTIYTSGEFFGKLVQLVHEVKPSAERIGVFMSYVPPFHPRAEASLIIRGLRGAAKPLGLDVRVFEIGNTEQVDAAIAAAVAQKVEALVLTSDASVVPRMKEILQFAVAKGLPTIVDAPWSELGDPQPLLVYGASFSTLLRQTAPYVNQILWKGVKPGDLPIQLPARFEFQVNLKTARAIGITIPPSILVRADQVIE
jgi:putative tryptophan/tyrosine transport system substrate-binding protein